ncbi:MAG: hypothetical protein V4506_11660 [Bacteroidota bacterium]
MENLALTNFVAAQKVESFIFICLGFIAILLSIFFLKIIKYSFFKGLAIILLLAGSWQITQGGYTLATCQEAHYQINAAGSIEDHENQHVEQKMITIKIYESISIVCFAVGIVLFIIFYKSVQTFWKGIGFGLILQGILLFVLFSVTECRLITYKETISNYKAT